MIQDTFTEREKLPLAQMTERMLKNPSNGFVYQLGKILTLVPELVREDLDQLALSQQAAARKTPGLKRLVLTKDNSDQRMDVAVGNDEIAVVISNPSTRGNNFNSTPLVPTTDETQTAERDSMFIVLKIALPKDDALLRADAYAVYRTVPQRETKLVPILEIEDNLEYLVALEENILEFIKGPEVMLGSEIIKAESAVSTSDAQTGHFFGA